VVPAGGGLSVDGDAGDEVLVLQGDGSRSERKRGVKMETGKVEFSDRFFNSAIPLVPDRRDSPSWARLKELEEELAVLTGKVAMLERDKDDMEAALARLMRAIPVDPVHDTKEEWR